MDVVPHHELAEGEESQQGFLQHVPALLSGDGLPYPCEDALHIHPMVVGRQWVHHTQVDAELLLQHLHQRGI